MNRRALPEKERKMQKIDYAKKMERMSEKILKNYPYLLLIDIVGRTPTGQEWWYALLQVESDRAPVIEILKHFGVKFADPNEGAEKETEDHLLDPEEIGVNFWRQLGQMALEDLERVLGYRPSQVLPRRTPVVNFKKFQAELLEWMLRSNMFHCKCEDGIITVDDTDPRLELSHTRFWRLAEDGSGVLAFTRIGTQLPVPDEDTVYFRMPPFRKLYEKDLTLIFSTTARLASVLKALRKGRIRLHSRSRIKLA